jgi:diacylglycerol kinase (ATP)
VRARAASLGHAWRGVTAVVRSQPNARIHVGATLAVVAAGFAFGVSRLEWGLLVLAMTAVWSAEALNTAVEILADVVSPAPHPAVGRAKDVAAGAVLLAAAGAVVVGVLVFGPRLVGLLRH